MTAALLRLIQLHPIDLSPALVGLRTASPGLQQGPKQLQDAHSHLSTSSVSTPRRLAAPKCVSCAASSPTGTQCVASVFWVRESRCLGFPPTSLFRHATAHRAGPHFPCGHALHFSNWCPECAPLLYGTVLCPPVRIPSASAVLCTLYHADTFTPHDCFLCALPPTAGAPVRCHCGEGSRGDRTRAFFDNGRRGDSQMRNRGHDHSADQPVHRCGRASATERVNIRARVAGVGLGVCAVYRANYCSSCSRISLISSHQGRPAELAGAHRPRRQHSRIFPAMPWPCRTGFLSLYVRFCFVAVLSPSLPSLRAPLSHRASSSVRTVLWNFFYASALERSSDDQVIMSTVSTMVSISSSARNNARIPSRASPSLFPPSTSLSREVPRIKASTSSK